MNVNAVVELVMRMEEEWLSREMVKLMPPDLFLRAYGNFACKLDVAQWMEKAGLHLEVHLSGKKELKRFDELIATFNPPRPTIQISNRHDPFSFYIP